MNNITTTDISEFGMREIKELARLLTAWAEDGLPHDFYNDGVVPMFNKQSGHVFLTNSDCQVAMMDGDELKSFYSCPECGFEGFAGDLLSVEANDCCAEFVGGL